MATIQENIEVLRAKFGALNGIDPAGPLYLGTIALLDKCDDAALKAVADAEIKFVSALARNRIASRARAAQAAAVAAHKAAGDTMAAYWAGSAGASVAGHVRRGAVRTLKAR